jgi:hypothetical protein
MSLFRGTFVQCTKLSELDILHDYLLGKHVITTVFTTRVEVARVVS